MVEGLAAEITAVVRRHLNEAHTLLGAMLARLDAGGEAELSEKAPTEAAKPTIAAPPPKPSTVQRRARLVRAKQRQAANEAATGETATPAGHWPVLRTEFHGAIKARHLSRAKVSAELDVSKGSVCGWLSPKGGPPSADNIVAIRAWLDKPAPQTETALVPETPAALDDWPALREELRTIIRDRGLTHAAVGAVLDVEGSTIGGWLAKSHEDRSPGGRAVGHIRAWLREGAAVPVTDAADASPFVLSEAEKTALTGHLALAGSAREIRDYFGVTKELAERAALGAHLDGEIISRLRGVLAVAE